MPCAHVVARLCPVLALLAAAGSAPAEVIQFQRSVGFTTSEIAYEMAPTSDGGYITVGRTSQTPTTPADIYVVKYDEIGNDQWTRIIGSVNQHNDVGHTIRQTRDGGYIIGAETDSVGSQLGIGLVKLNAAGAMVWSRVDPGTPFRDSPAGVELSELADGSIVVVGRHSFGPAGSPLSGVFLRIDATGMPIVLNRYSEVGAASDGGSLSFADFVSVSDGYVIAGWLTDATGTQRQAFVMKTNPAGVPTWARTHIITGVDSTADSIMLAPGNVAYAGRFGPTGSMISRVDLAGNWVWTRVVNGFRPGFAAAANDADDFAVFAGTALNPTDGALLKFDPLGTFAGGMRYGDDSGPTHEHDVIVMPCNFGYGLAGDTRMLTSNGQEDVHLLRTNRDGETGCREKIFTPGISSPQPFVVQRFISMTSDVQHITWGVVVTSPNSGNIRYCVDVGCVADLNGDGFIDFADYLEFLNLYDAESPCVDFNGDGFVDFADYLEFLNHYDAGC